MTISANTAWHAWRFRSELAELADYYEYLAETLTITAGRKTLLNILRDDADRYGENTHRGHLSALWSQRLQEFGNLADAFQGTLPDDDVVLIRMALKSGGRAQESGTGALEQTLSDLAEVTRLAAQSRAILWQTLSVAVLCLLVLAGMLSLIPLVIVPFLRSNFSRGEIDLGDMLRDGGFLDGVALAYLTFGDALAAHGLWLLAALALAGWIVFWSLGHYTGQARPTLDRIGPWALYRDLQGVRFLALLATTVRRRAGAGGGSTLLQAIEHQEQGAPPWRAHHLGIMASRIRQGQASRADSYRIFDTGLLDRQTYYRLSDLMLTCDLSTALQRVRSRIADRILPRIGARAQRMRWLILLFVLLSMLGLLVWYYATTYALTQAMQTYS